MRISDCSSDVCSSDLPGVAGQEKRGAVKLWGGGTASARGAGVTVSPCFAGFLQARNLFLRARDLYGGLMRGFVRYILLPGLGTVLLLLVAWAAAERCQAPADRKSTRLNSSH